MSIAKKEKEIVCAVAMSVESEKTTVGDFTTKQQANLLAGKKRSWRTLPEVQTKLRKYIASTDKDYAQRQRWGDFLTEEEQHDLARWLDCCRDGEDLTDEELLVAFLQTDFAVTSRELPEPSAKEREKFERWARRHKVKLKPSLPPVTQQELDEARESKVSMVVLHPKVTCMGEEYEERQVFLSDDVRAELLLEKLRSPETDAEFRTRVLEASIGISNDLFSERYEEVYGAKFETLIEFMLKYLPNRRLWREIRETDKVNKTCSPQERMKIIKVLHEESIKALKAPDDLLKELVMAKKGDRYEKHPGELALKHTAKLMGKTCKVPQLKKLLRDSKKVSEQVIRVLEASEQTSQYVHEYNEVIA